MYVCMFVYLSVCLWMCGSVLVSVYVCLCLSACVCVSVGTDACARTFSMAHHIEKRSFENNAMQVKEKKNYLPVTYCDSFRWKRFSMFA